MVKHFDEGVLVSGRYFTEHELNDIVEMVRMFTNLSRDELVKTVCENLEWVTPNGKYKKASCLQLFNKLEARGLITLPSKQEHKIHDNKEQIQFLPRTDPGLLLEGQVADLGPVNLELVRSRDDRKLWNEYVHRYHVLGYKRPFGAHQRYFITSEAVSEPLGCLLFAAASWALWSRDEWIGWSEVDKSLRLNLIVNNSRFLIFPWVRVNNLASRVLSLTAKRIGDDWQERYGYRPVLLETFVDQTQYRGTCYRAANWHYLGQTRGRGRMDRYKQKSLTPKDIYVYPLRPDFRAVLRGESGGAK